MIEDSIAELAHEVNKAYCDAIGDISQKSWAKCESWQRESAVAGVRAVIDNRNITAEELHERWCQHKIDAGWKYGMVKDAVKKEHPCLVPYNKLPLEQRVKDSLFRAIVLTAMKF